MIVFDLRCSKGHIFEDWFYNSDDLAEKIEEGLVRCPYCGDTKVKKILSPVRVAKNNRPKELPDPPQKVAMNLMLKALNDFVEKHFEDVGDQFAVEALKIHYGVAEPRNIRGNATPEEEEVLKEEGVEFYKIPKPDPTHRVSLN